MSRRSFRWRFT